MGRWAQSRKRGSDSVLVAAAALPEPPGDADWTWAQSGDPSAGDAVFVGAPDPAAIGWQLFADENPDPVTYADQAPVSFDALVLSPAGIIFTQYAKVRYIVSGAGFGDPGTVYSNFSTVKSYDPV